MAKCHVPYEDEARSYRIAFTGRLAGDCEEGGDTERGPARDGVDVHPKGDPRDDDDQDRGDVRLHHVEAHGTTQVKLGHEAAVIS